MSRDTSTSVTSAKELKRGLTDHELSGNRAKPVCPLERKVRRQGNTANSATHGTETFAGAPWQRGPDTLGCGGWYRTISSIEAISRTIRLAETRPGVTANSSTCGKKP